uniref:Reverse transcriptase domain-containing protein n=1 Tax=Tanacetum cinerariifolium TaxID=118510 RepID=A0A6L2NR11_TANCI|nr:hypothetical protein [Tanacetum cinerariifolium]
MRPNTYDTVDWRFLETILSRFGFHPLMTKWIMACVSSTSFSICVNGDVHGFFKGRRGLRQGDPLSSYLFTLVMAVLTLIMKRQVRNSESFRYHKHCEELELTNVCFADDLFMFARGDVNSAQVIMDSLNEFKRVSGLVPSLPNSTVFFWIATFFLVENAHNRIGDWKNKSLSIGGRLQLCNSVISSMHVYWASVLMTTAKVAWNDICLPKSEEGLGIQNLELFNIALITTHVRNIISNKESLWVRWIHTCKLRGRSFWDVPLKSNVSRGWLILLQLRVLVRPYFSKQIGNGCDVSVWFYMWSNECPLIRYLSPRDISREGFTLQANVAELVSSEGWRWTQAWLLKAPILGLIVKPSLDVNKMDTGGVVRMKLAGMDTVPARLVDIVEYLQHIATQRSAESIIGRLLLAASSYFIWIERNNRTFKQVKRTPKDIRDTIMVTVRLKLLTLKFKNTIRVNQLLSFWNMPNNVRIYED